MFEWLEEMEPFLERNMSAFMKKHGITNTSQISDRHPAAQEMRHYLQRLEDAYAERVGRKPIDVTLSSPNTALLWENPTSDKRDVYFDFQDNYYHFAWYPNVCALKYVLQFIHEYTHANQTLNFNITPEEFKLTATERACLTYTEAQCYWSQYTEMRARMAEYEAWNTLVTAYKDKFTLSELTQLERYGKDLADRLTFRVTDENIKLLKDIQNGCLQQRTANTKYLSEAFPHWFKHSVIADASKFLNSDDANALHQQCYIDIVHMEASLRDTLEKLQQHITTCKEQAHENAKQQKEDEIRAISKECNIPIQEVVKSPPSLARVIDPMSDIHDLINKYKDEYILSFGQIEVGAPTPTWYLLGDFRQQNTDIDTVNIDDLNLDDPEL